MSNRIQINTWVQGDCTLGRLSYGNFRCFTLELPWKDNQTDISCIPEGSYPVIRYDSPSKGDVLLLEGTGERKWIEIHSGNYTSQILGCLLVGDGIKYLNSDNIPDVTNSRNTLRALLKRVVYPAYVDIKRS
jgi:hypothetical protein